MKTYHFLCGRTGKIYNAGEFKDFDAANEHLMKDQEVVWLWESKPRIVKLPTSKETKK